MSARLESEGRTGEPRRVAIVDFGMGNLFSVEQACLAVGLAPSVTKDRRAVEGADIVILPGVGAFGDAMENLRSRDLIGPLRDVAASGRLLIGICLGLQMLMDESEEFGAHKGLGLVSGTVLRLAPTRAGAKVPQIGWNRVYEARPGAWADTPFEGQRDSVYMYFVHSYYVTPADTKLVTSTTNYEGVTYCSALRAGSVHAFQFHPERSGPAGLNVYRAIARLAATSIPA